MPNMRILSWILLPKAFRESIIFGTSCSLHYTSHECAEHLEFTFRHGETACCTLQYIYTTSTHTLRVCQVSAPDVSLLGCCTAYIHSLLPVFCDKVSISSSRVKQPKKTNYQPTLCNIQNSEDIDCPAVDTWTHLFLCSCSTLHGTCCFGTSSPIFWTTLTAGTGDPSPALPWPPYWIWIIFWKQRIGNNLAVFLK